MLKQKMTPESDLAWLNQTPAKAVRQDVNE